MFNFLEVGYQSIVDIPRLVIMPGQVTALTGPSGGGKTTILRMLNKMISPTRGTIYFKERDLAEIDSVAHRRQVGMLSQQPVIFPGCIGDNLRRGFFLQERPIPAEDALGVALEKVSLAKGLKDDATLLSGGEKQRLALARLLLLQPEVYLLDEPSSALDAVTEDEIIAMLVRESRQDRATLIIVTHSLAVAAKYADTILQVESGKVGKGAHDAGSD
jgi:putative ABC transport system ATP-binding protein